MPWLNILAERRWTIGWAWAEDYGTSDDSKEFDYLYAYSPVHNVTKEKYPATLITTADHDDRVVPAHSFKFGAELQANQQAESSPILVRIEKQAGHGAGKPISKSIAEGADIDIEMPTNFAKVDQILFFIDLAVEVFSEH